MTSSTLSEPQDEREAIVAFIRTYGEANLELAGDSILLDPILRGKGFTPENIEESEKQQINGCIHSSKYHAACDLIEMIERGEHRKCP